jgi:hypothetical protein
MEHLPQAIITDRGHEFTFAMENPGDSAIVGHLVLSNRQALSEVSFGFPQESAGLE